MVFYSGRPGAYFNKRCELNNGVVVYYGRNDLDCTCLAQFRADPDFAGPLIIALFLALDWLTILVSAIPSVRIMYIAWKSAKGPRRFWRWAMNVVHFESDGVESRRTNIVVFRMRNPRETELRRSRFTEPRYCLLARRMLLHLCDVQIAAGIFILIYAFSQINKISYYHAQFASQLWWLTLYSFWVSRIDYSRHTPEMATNSASVRRLVITVSVALSLAMQVIVIIREGSHWDLTKPGRCYVAQGLGTSTPQNVFWLVGTAIYFASMLLSLFPPTRRLWEQHVTAKVEPSILAMARWVAASETQATEYAGRAKYDDTAPPPSRGKRLLTLFALHARTAARGVALALWYLFILFMTIWCAGNSAALLELIIYVVFAAFLTWWLIFLKTTNIPLIVGNEQRITGVQLLLLVVVAVLLLVKMCDEVDRAKEESDPWLDGARRDEEVGESVSGSALMAVGAMGSHEGTLPRLSDETAKKEGQ